MEIEKAGTKNILQDAHNFVLGIPKSFRDRVCEECGWSEATFYRRAKSKNGFSNAEREKIISVMNQILRKSMLLQQKKFKI
ncbi:hypothetical protein LX64_02726 [Chitinophaga skermanii]|uniref:Uncharacterized protein n=1 Tax=Chitinophaga skermanii TaxID=331697 RepID=A0A327QH24_9BACT|nr:hypothetical protein [Chitinophaga skermanii]RAJ03849.1 hypothetical protein LX64_02726 [Chitinophaga skermanii]